jgi:hypothetical protein
LPRCCGHAEEHGPKPTRCLKPPDRASCETGAIHPCCRRSKQEAVGGATHPPLRLATT